MRSAGLLPFRTDPLVVLIAHPGGPFFAGREDGAWSVVKGMVKPEESDLDAAAREFEEETGWPAPLERWIHLGETVMRSRKIVVTWAIEHDFDLETFAPGMFTMHGREYPEIDRVEWVAPERARVLLNPAFSVFLDRLEDHLSFNGLKE